MAERRMFAKTIIDSDAFLDMPPTTQNLYFHLGMRADDDGFVNKPKAVMSMIGSKEDDIKILISKKFIIPFENGIVVLKHWKIHNFIAKDRYTETKYKEEKASLELDDNKSYKLPVNTLSTECIQVVNEMDTQVRLGKDRLGKVSIEDIYRQRFDEFWQLYPRKVGKADACKSWMKIKPTRELHERIIDKVSAYKQSDLWKEQNGRFIPNPATWLNQGRWEDEIYKQTKSPKTDILTEIIKEGMKSESNRNSQNNETDPIAIPRLLQE